MEIKQIAIVSAVFLAGVLLTAVMIAGTDMMRAAVLGYFAGVASMVYFGMMAAKKGGAKDAG